MSWRWQLYQRHGLPTQLGTSGVRNRHCCVHGHQWNFPRKISGSRACPRHQRPFLRNNLRWRNEQLGHGIQHHNERKHELISLFQEEPTGPSLAPLVQGSDGNFYGTTSTGGTNGSTNGTVFKITWTSGSPLPILRHSPAPTALWPEQLLRPGLVQGTDGYFYSNT